MRLVVLGCPSAGGQRTGAARQHLTRSRRTGLSVLRRPAHHRAAAQGNSRRTRKPHSVRAGNARHRAFSEQSCNACNARNAAPSPCRAVRPLAASAPPCHRAQSPRAGSCGNAALCSTLRRTRRLAGSGNASAGALGCARARVCIGTAASTRSRLTGCSNGRSPAGFAGLRPPFSANVGRHDFKMKHCIACRGELDDLATFCPACKSYQAAWRNWLPVVGGLTALAALLGSVIAYTASTVTQMTRAYGWADRVAVLDLTSDIGVTVLNSGDLPIFLQHVELIASVDDPSTSTTNSWTIGSSINQVISPHSFYTTRPLITPRWVPKTGEDYEYGYSILPTKSDQQLSYLLKNAQQGECILLLLKPPSSPSIANYLRTYGPDLRLVEATGRLRVISSLDGKSHDVSIRLRGVFGVLKVPECQRTREAFSRLQ